MPDKKLTDNEIIKEIQGIRESMKRHIDLTNEMGQDLLRIDAEYTGGSKVWLTTDYFKKVVKHFSHSNYLVKCLELIFDYINRLQAENERLKEENEIKSSKRANIFEIVDAFERGKAEAYKEFAELLSTKANVQKVKILGGLHTVKVVTLHDINSLKKELERENCAK